MATDETRPTHKSQQSTATIMPLEIQVPDHTEDHQAPELNPILFEASPLSAVTPTPLTLQQTPLPTASGPSQLDDLLSPTITEFETESVRESVAASDITDDERFSTVLLSSARQSLESPEISVNDIPLSFGEPEDAPVEEKNDTNTLSGDDLVRLVHTTRPHKKTASTSTIMSANNVPFILARLDNDENDDGSRRQSLDGQQKLQEEFTKMQSGQDRQTQESAANSIDWGM